ncbi:MAG: hypothetical protein QXN86_02230 [Candidatus Methanomethylicaceae archaeon]
MIKEGEIYIAMKGWLMARGWSIVGGEPPSGTNTIPRIEIKDPTYTGRGSKGSRKIDLVSFKEGYFLFTEMKPRYNFRDAEKLQEIVGKKELRKAFLEAMKEKKAMPPKALRDECYVEESRYLIKSLAFNRPSKDPDGDFVFFIVLPSAISAKFGPHITGDVRLLFAS